MRRRIALLMAMASMVGGCASMRATEPEVVGFFHPADEPGHRSR